MLNRRDLLARISGAMAALPFIPKVKAKELKFSCRDVSNESRDFSPSTAIELVQKQEIFSKQGNCFVAFRTCQLTNKWQTVLQLESPSASTIREVIVSGSGQHNPRAVVEFWLVSQFKKAENNIKVLSVYPDGGPNIIAAHGVRAPMGATKKHWHETLCSQSDWKWWPWGTPIACHNADPKRFLAIVARAQKLDPGREESVVMHFHISGTTELPPS